MRVAAVRVVFAMAACLVGLAGCESYNKTVAWLNTPPGDQQASATGSGSATTTGTSANASPAEPDTTGSIGPPGPDPVAAGVVPPGEDPNDDLNLGKRHFREANYGLAERYFRRAAEKAPGEAHRDAEAWLASPSVWRATISSAFPHAITPAQWNGIPILRAPCRSSNRASGPCYGWRMARGIRIARSRMCSACVRPA